MNLHLYKKTEITEGHHLWRGAYNSDGYGLVCINKKLRRAHRISLELRLGRTLIPGFFACHKQICPFRHCINPEHLYEGTPQQNAQERYDTPSKLATLNEIEAYTRHKEAEFQAVVGVWITSKKSKQ